MVPLWALLSLVSAAAGEDVDGPLALRSRLRDLPEEPPNLPEEEMIEGWMADFAAALEAFYQSYVSDYETTRKYLNVVSKSSPLAVQAAAMCLASVWF